MPRILVTGANGAGKTHFAAALAARLPGLAPVSFDALKLLTRWRQRPRHETEAALADLVATEHWIIDGGPSMLPLALPRATAVVWLDPPTAVRAARLAWRPWRWRGRTRPELPTGNFDSLWRQYRFGLASLRRSSAFRAEIGGALGGDHAARVFRVRTRADRAAALASLTR